MTDCNMFAEAERVKASIDKYGPLTVWEIQAALSLAYAAGVDSVKPKGKVWDMWAKEGRRLADLFTVTDTEIRNENTRLRAENEKLQKERDTCKIMVDALEGEHGITLKNGELWRGDLDELVYQFIEIKAENEKLCKVKEAAIKHRKRLSDSDKIYAEILDNKNIRWALDDTVIQLDEALVATEYKKGTS